MPKKSSRIKRKLTHKYRLVIVSDDNFEEKFSLRLSRLNVFVVGGLLAALLVVLTTMLLIFTPLKEFIPGYSSNSSKKKAIELVYQVDSLKTKLRYLNEYTKAMQPVFKGEIPYEKIDSLTQQVQILIDEDKLNPSVQDSIFRQKVKQQGDLLLKPKDSVSTKFLPPVIGLITTRYNEQEKQFSIDITTDSIATVKSIADGSVVATAGSQEEGYEIIIQHSHNFISIYKHNSTLTKQKGDLVKSGEEIAKVRATKEEESVWYLQFELWKNGLPTNPEKYINFQ